MALDKVHDMRDFLNFEETSGETARRVTVYPGAGNPPIPVVLDQISNYIIRNESLTANTEASISTSIGSVGFIIKSRSGRPIKVRKVSAGAYFTIPAGVSWERNSLDPTVSLTFIFEMTINDVLEIIELT